MKNWGLVREEIRREFASRKSGRHTSYDVLERTMRSTMIESEFNLDDFKQIIMEQDR